MVFSRLFGKPKHPREPVFSGLFYPASEDELRALLEQALSSGPKTARAIVVPHSDLTLVAPLCGAAFARLMPAKRVVVVAPSHKIPFAGLAVPNADGWTTPLGTSSIDVDAYDGLGETGHVRVIDAAFDAEPGVELQVPWLQVTGESPLIPMLCGDAKAGVLVDVLDALVDDETALVVAAELSRDVAEAEVRVRDRSTLDAVNALDPEAIDRTRVTAATPLRALLMLALRRGWVPETLEYRTSTDLGARGERAAGFAAVALRDG